MKANDRQRVVDLYDQRLANHGYSNLTLGWPKGRQALRFEVLLGHWDVSGQHVLDFGCGFGDMYGYMRGHAIDAEYTGVDICERLIEEGRRVYPSARLECVDALADGLPDECDYVLSSGVHNLRFEASADNDAFMHETFAFFDRVGRRGFAVNFLSDRVDHRVEHLHYTDPCAALALAYSYSNRVVLRNDYMPFEFTLFVDKQTAFEAEAGVYLDHLRPPGR